MSEIIILEEPQSDDPYAVFVEALPSTQTRRYVIDTENISTDNLKHMARCLVRELKERQATSNPEFPDIFHEEIQHVERAVPLPEEVWDAREPVQVDISRRSIPRDELVPPSEEEIQTRITGNWAGNPFHEAVRVNVGPHITFTGDR